MSGQIHSERKLAEKLLILNDRGVGMLTRLYNIKKNFDDAKSKPEFFFDKNLESSIKHIVRKFPNIDVKPVNVINNIKSDIIESLSLSYYTFVDILDFKDNVCELLTSMDAWGVNLDINLNFELTTSYLDLVATFVSMMILLSKVEDKKVILGLFNLAYEMTHNQIDQSFPRLASMIIEYDVPLKKLADDFVHHNRILTDALMSLEETYSSRNVSADTWRVDLKLSLVNNPASLVKPLISEKSMSCEYLSMDAMERWIIFGTVLIPNILQPESGKSEGFKIWIKALESCWVIPLFRDEVIYIHPYIISYFDTIKGFGKRISEVKECQTHAIQKAGYKHRERRKYLRTALKELGLILTDQPGLLGPKALIVFMSLCYARDEVLWLLRHNDNPQQKYRTKLTEDLVDRQLPELLFHMEELRDLVRKYSKVMQRYYIQYLFGEAINLKNLLQNLHNCPEEEGIILSSLYDTISNLSVEQVEENEIFDFTAFRLDWFRLQALMSTIKSPLNIMKNQELVSLLDTAQFHTRMVDHLDAITVECSDLSIYCFYSKIFEEQFDMCLEFPGQNRFIIAFPLICCHFENCTHELCPEEIPQIDERSRSFINMFLDEMAKETKNIITAICDEQCKMSDKLLPKYCAPLIASQMNRKKKDKKKKNAAEMEKPGKESYRKNRENLTTMDKLHMALTELCFAINYCGTINVCEYTFAPREYLTQHLQRRFAQALVGMVMYSPDSNVIAKPSQLLMSVRTYMNVLQTVENYVHIDITRVFNNCLLQQTQPTDTQGCETITSLYTNWYSEVFLHKVSEGNICYSGNQRTFVSLSADGIPFNAEEYSDINELRALAELIGPYGMKQLSKTLMWHIANQVQKLKKLVEANKQVLIALRTNFNKPDVVKEQFKKLTDVENLLQRMTIVGEILCFRQLAQSALTDVLEQRIPFLINSIVEFKDHLPNGVLLKVVNEMSVAAGLPCKVDPTLINALKLEQPEVEENEHLQVCLLMVFVAVSIPKLAKEEKSLYKAYLEGHVNNIHCMATAINHIFGALFTICGQGDIEDRMKEFLALASLSLLKLGQEADKEAIRNRESVYLLLDQIVQESPFLTMDLLESRFPYALIRNAFHAVYKHEQVIV